MGLRSRGVQFGCLVLLLRRSSSRDVVRMCLAYHVLYLGWTCSQRATHMGLELLVLGNRCVGVVLLRPGVRSGIMDCHSTVADVVLSTTGDPGLRAVVAVGRVMHQPVVRHDALPVAVVPEPVGVPLRQA